MSSPNVRLFLHIGTHKTGTTSLQSALAVCASDCLYPASGRPVLSGTNERVAHHHMLAWTALEKQASRCGLEISSEHWDTLLEELDSMSADRAVVSSEFFSLAEVEDIRRIRGYLDEIDTTIVVYLRNHWDYAVSGYKQIVKQGASTVRFREHVSNIESILDYDAFLNSWKSEFDVEMRIYDKVRGDLVGDLAQVTGCTIEAQPRRNVSPGRDAVRTLRLLNVLERKLPVEGFGWYRKARRNIRGGRWPGSLVSAFVDQLPGRLIDEKHDRPWFLERTAESRRRFVERHVHPDDWTYYDI